MAGWEVSKRGPSFYMTLISSALTEWQALFTTVRSCSIFQWLSEKLFGGEQKVNKEKWVKFSLYHQLWIQTFDLVYLGRLFSSP